VQIRFWKGVGWNPAESNRCIAATTSTTTKNDDIRIVGYPGTVGSLAEDMLERERVQRYPSHALENSADLLFRDYVNTNRPTSMCYCTGYTLLSAAKHLNGKVPVSRGGGNVLYPVAEKFGTKVTDSAAMDEGDIAFYYRKGDTLANPCHVAYFVDNNGNVVSKDENERVYRMPYDGRGIGNISKGVAWCESATNVVVYHMPWRDLSVRFVGGSCRIITNSVALPSGSVKVGTDVDIRFPIEVTNPAKTAMEITASASIVGPSGGLLAPERVTVVQTAPSASGNLTGQAHISIPAQKAGSGTLILRAHAKQASDREEPEVHYDSGLFKRAFTIGAKPKLEARITRIVPPHVLENTIHRAIIDYSIQGVPVVSNPVPYQLVRKMTHTFFNSDYDEVSTVYALTNSIRGGFNHTWTNVLSGGRGGQAYVDVELRLTHPQLPIDTTFRLPQPHEYRIHMK